VYCMCCIAGLCIVGLAPSRALTEASSFSAMGLGFDDELWDVVQLVAMTMVLAGGVYQWCRWSWAAVRRLGHGVTQDQLMTTQCQHGKAMVEKCLDQVRRRHC
jgi:hypothetical protein